MMPQEIIVHLGLEPTPPPWDGEIKEIRATVMANRSPVRVRVLDIYKFGSLKMAYVEGVEGKPFSSTNLWHHTSTTSDFNVQIAYIKEVSIIYS